MTETQPITELPTRTFGPISRSDIVRYQGASGDFNPIHHDEEFARSSGATTVFSVGMLQAGYLATYCTDLFGLGNVIEFSVRFHDRVWPGAELTCAGTIEGADLSLTVTDQDGTLVVSGRAVVRR